MMNSTLHTLLQSFQIPSDLARYENITDATILTRLNEWKRNAHHTLNEIRTLLRNLNASTDLSLQEQASVISVVAAFDGNDPWITPASRNSSRDILQQFSEPEDTLLIQILTYNVKPLFLSNPHPSLNIQSGRKLPRPAGGPLASQDFYEGQSWKDKVGTPNSVSWCVRNLRRDAYETSWHLIIPPVMTLLDDYEARYKLQGVEIVSEMLRRVPKELLKRTGVDGLMRTSLSTCLTHLQNPETPQLLKAAISTQLSLTFLTTDLGSSDRFNQLCTLLGENIIGGIWLYASENSEVILASLDALPLVVRALGIGNARYLKALMLQLIHLLLPNPLNPPPVELQVSSLRVLEILIDECAPCMPRWKFTILDGVGRCWVTLKDSGSITTNSKLRMHLQNACASLAKSCPSVVEEEYKTLLSSDPEMFGDLFGGAAPSDRSSPSSG